MTDHAGRMRQEIGDPFDDGHKRHTSISVQELTVLYNAEEGLSTGAGEDQYVMIVVARFRASIDIRAFLSAPQSKITCASLKLKSPKEMHDDKIKLPLCQPRDRRGLLAPFSEAHKYRRVGSVLEGLRQGSK